MDVSRFEEKNIIKVIKNPFRLEKEIKVTKKKNTERSLKSFRV